MAELMQLCAEDAFVRSLVMLVGTVLLVGPLLGALCIAAGTFDDDRGC